MNKNVTDASDDSIPEIVANDHNPVGSVQSDATKAESVPRTATPPASSQAKTTSPFNQPTDQQKSSDLIIEGKTPFDKDRPGRPPDEAPPLETDAASNDANVQQRDESAAPTQDGQVRDATPLADVVKDGDGSSDTHPAGGDIKLEIQAPAVHRKPLIFGLIESVALDELEDHPLNRKLYSKAPLEPLVLSIQDRGISTPLKARWVNSKRQLLCGHRRKEAARLARLTHVPVIMTEVADDRAAEELLVEDNNVREKSTEEKLREFGVLYPKAKEEAKERQKTNAKVKPGKTFSQAEHGKAGEIAAAKIGYSRPTAIKGFRVALAIDKLKSEGQVNAADDLRRVLNEQSIDGAYKAAIAAGHIPKSPPKKNQTGGDKPLARDKGTDQPAGDAADKAGDGDKPKDPTPRMGQQPAGGTEAETEESGTSAGPAAVTSSETFDADAPRDVQGEKVGVEDDPHSLALQKAYDTEVFLSRASDLNAKQKVDWQKVVERMVKLLGAMGVKVSLS